jgi:hypothetical protein
MKRKRSEGILVPAKDAAKYTKLLDLQRYH